ncbi:hypothetical protein [Saccharopolyspora phatthalungensis]|uniref:Uncharacterized protein n=1 Tax=Saccharopolyspora phatthalungensis TaxID=664693 RepID=A0A840PZQ0_9PSEU|nr:hypothetical protein [Saccharopolyspora phatthalungensis]MBB5153210.1 hypothetical protein [Saccharopolyspora phatthalungensis]
MAPASALMMAQVRQVPCDYVIPSVPDHRGHPVRLPDHNGIGAGLVAFAVIKITRRKWSAGYP